MLKHENVNESFWDLERIKNLYMRAFPENEQRPFEEFINDPRGANHMLAFYEGAEFVGFVVLMESKIDISYLTFFAVEEAFRAKGYGTKILTEVRRLREGRRIICEIELFNPFAKNKEQRRKRRAFYLRNGYKPTTIFFRVKKENFQMLVNGGTFTRKDFQQFWKNL